VDGASGAQPGSLFMFAWVSALIILGSYARTDDSLSLDMEMAVALRRGEGRTGMLKGEDESMLARLMLLPVLRFGMSSGLEDIVLPRQHCCFADVARRIRRMGAKREKVSSFLG